MVRLGKPMRVDCFHELVGSLVAGKIAEHERGDLVGRHTLLLGALWMVSEHLSSIHVTQYPHSLWAMNRIVELSQLIG